MRLQSLSGSNEKQQTPVADTSSKLARILVFVAGLALIISGAVPLARRILADTKPAVQLNVSNAAPREVEDNTEQAVLRDYTAAWKGLSSALANNSLAPLNENFTGFALDKLTQRVKDQKKNGLTTRIIDHGHKVEAVFYSPDGSAIELKDTASLETQVLDGGSIIHSDQAQMHYYAVLTGAEDRWKVRVLESAK
jgi:hypothetical protein